MILETCGQNCRMRVISLEIRLNGVVWWDPIILAIFASNLQRLSFNAAAFLLPYITIIPLFSFLSPWVYWLNEMHHLQLGCCSWICGIIELALSFSIHRDIIYLCSCVVVVNVITLQAASVYTQHAMSWPTLTLGPCLITSSHEFLSLMKLSLNYWQKTMN